MPKRNLAFALIFFALSTEAATSNDFILASDGLLNNGPMPTVFTCDGLNVSPELHWSDVPTKTQSLVLIVSDPDAQGDTFFHWILFNIPPTTQSLDQATQKYPLGVLLGKNSFNKNQYSGPCPPKGSAHHYNFTLYAVDKKLSLPTGTDGKTLLTAMKGHVLKETSLISIYSRWF